VASLLALLALVTLAVKTVLEWQQARDFELAQQEQVGSAMVDS
jgi:ABC-type sulfate transport system permease subunit